MQRFIQKNKTDYEEAGRQGEGISGLAFGDASNIASGLEGTMSQTNRMRALQAKKARLNKSKRYSNNENSFKPGYKAGTQ